MPKIEEYIAKTRHITPVDTGYNALEQGARRIGQAARQEQQDYEGIARAHKDIATSLGKQAEDARLSAGLQSQMIDEFKGVFEENAIGARAAGGVGHIRGGKGGEDPFGIFRNHAWNVDDAGGQIAAGANHLTGQLAQVAAKKRPYSGVQTVYDNSWWDRHMQEQGYSRNSDGGWSYGGPGGMAPGKATPDSEFKPDPWDIPQGANGGYPLPAPPSTADHIANTIGDWWQKTFGSGIADAANDAAAAEGGVPAPAHSTEPAEETVHYDTNTGGAGADFGSTGEQ